jgi:hypothetical protein
MTPTPEYTEAYARKDAARKKMLGVGSFGYMVINARYDRNPIPLTGHGLPCFFARGDLIKEKAEETAGAGARLSRIYMAGALQRWYEFENSGTFATVNAMTLQEDAFEVIEAAMDHIAQRDSVEPRRQLYAEKWQKLTSELNANR